MDLYDKYIDYLKDNPEGYWFKRKLYGYGWTPAKPQGWAVVAFYILGVVYFVRRLEEATGAAEVRQEVILPILVMTLLLIAISYWKGEKPRWQWGLPKEAEEKID